MRLFIRSPIKIKIVRNRFVLVSLNYNSHIQICLCSNMNYRYEEIKLCLFPALILC